MCKRTPRKTPPTKAQRKAKRERTVNLFYRLLFGPLPKPRTPRRRATP